MVSGATVKRLVATAADFDLTGLQIIGYYLRLYAIEAILGDEGSTAEFMGLVTELMKDVEDYKGSIQATEESEGQGSVYSLIHDQKKAETYISNFAMSLYNGKLKQIQTGPWDYTLQRGLWCCVDLLSCVAGLWGDADGTWQKRLKYCKLYLTKLAKGELGVESSKGEPKISTSESGAPSLPEKRDESIEVSTGSVSDEEITAMLNKLRAATDNTSEDDSEVEAADITDISLPQAPRIKPSRPKSEDEPSSEAEPKFIDSDEEDEVMTSQPEPEKPKKTHREDRPRENKYTQDQLHSMMERSGEIEKVQKLAKYAISALNYDDIATAKDELVKALEILKSLE